MYKNLIVGFMLAFGVFALIGCDEESGIHSYDDNLLENIRYVKDPNTKLCFAYAFHGNAMAMTTVPCESVEKYLAYNMIKSMNIGKVDTTEESLEALANKPMIEYMRFQLPEMEEKAVIGDGIFP